MLHGIGLVGIPSALIAYDAPLKGTQQALFQTYPEIAWNLLKGLEFPYPVAEMVYQHMERLDGSGFPRGLSGAAILPGARIVAVACEAARMLGALGQKPPAGAEEAVKALQRGSGTLYEDKAVDACVRHILKTSDAVPA
jgi:response regulator RpfG family c-di-GMP phosphodiesterase